MSINEVKFGDKISFFVSPGITMTIQASLEEWLINLSNNQSIDLDRETIAQAKEIIRLILLDDKSQIESSNQVQMEIEWPT